MAALDFPNSPTTNQQYAAPNGVTYQYDGAAWVVTGGPPGQLWTGGTGTLTPTDPTKRVVVPGPTASGADQSQIGLGTRTQKGRLFMQPGADWYGAMLNQWYDGSAWHADDSTKPCWGWNFYNDFFTIARAAGTTPGTGASFLNIDSNGILYLPGSGAPNACISLGSATIKNRLLINSGNWSTNLNLNPAGSAWVQDDATKPSWMASLDPSADKFYLYHMPAAGAFSAIYNVDNAGNLTIIGATATKASGTTWANPSDRRLKDDIADYATGLAAIVALSPRTFVYNGKGGSTAGLRGYGFIADEVAPVMPEMLGSTTAKLNPDDEHDTEIQTLDTSNLVLALTNAVKELAARVVALEAHAA